MNEQRTVAELLADREIHAPYVARLSASWSDEVLDGITFHRATRRPGIATPLPRRRWFLATPVMVSLGLLVVAVREGTAAWESVPPELWVGYAGAFAATVLARRRIRTTLRHALHVMR